MSDPRGRGADTVSGPNAEVRHSHGRSWPWLVAAVVLCPCHLPLTVGLLVGGLGAGSLATNLWLLAVPLAAGFGFALWRASTNEKRAESCRACRSRG